MRGEAGQRWQKQVSSLLQLCSGIGLYTSLCLWGFGYFLVVILPPNQLLCSFFTFSIHNIRPHCYLSFIFSSFHQKFTFHINYTAEISPVTELLPWVNPESLCSLRIPPLVHEHKGFSQLPLPLLFSSKLLSPKNVIALMIYSIAKSRSCADFVPQNANSYYLMHIRHVKIQSTWKTS
jgi:hypothetical protein